MNYTTDYIFDGEIHAINDEFAYIIEKYIEYIEEDEKRREYFKKYIDYLFEQDISLHKILHLIHAELTFQFVKREPWIEGPLCQYGTFSMKFQRIKGDNLQDKENGTNSKIDR